jgi:hypothetical protein
VYRFVAYIRDVLARRTSGVDYFAPEALRAVPEGHAGVLAFTRGSYLLTGNYRWQTPATTLLSSGVPPTGIDGAQAIALAVSEWNGTDSAIEYEIGPQDNSATGGLAFDDGKSTVLFGDPNGEVAPPPVIAIGGAWGEGTYSLDGETFTKILEGDVVVSAAFSAPQCVMNSGMIHEVGHTLGFRHSNQTPSEAACPASTAQLECTENAVMNSFVTCSIGTLRQWDRDAAATVYGTGPVCGAPFISTQPQSRSIVAGRSATLAVAVEGTAPFTYEWFVGNSGDASQPAGTESSLTVTPASTTAYWVRVSGPCAPPANSTTAIVTVTPCPGITVTASSSPLANGDVRLNAAGVSAGERITYIWFRGTTPGSGGVEAGTSRQLTVSGKEPASYWVQARNGCGKEAVSNLVTVGSCTVPSITTQPLSQEVKVGDTVELAVVATGTPALQYQWLEGSTHVGTNAATFTTVVTRPTSFQVRVTNGCGQAESTVAQISLKSSKRRAVRR